MNKGLSDNLKKSMKAVLMKTPSMLANPFIRKAILLYYKRLWAARSNQIGFTYFSIENTNICNASCKMCGYKKMTRPKRVMPYEDFCRIVDIAKKDKMKEVLFGPIGEPFTDKGIFDKIEYALKNSMAVGALTTNASLLNEQRAKNLLKYPVQSVHISLDSINKDTYEAIRGLNYEQVEHNIITLLNMRKKNKLFSSSFTMSMVVTDQNKHEVEAYFKKWSRYLMPGLDRVTFLYATNYAGVSDLSFCDNNNPRILRIPCGRLWNKMISVGVNGDIILCCWDYDVDNKIGNVLEEGSFRNFWNNSKMQYFRKLHIDGKFDQIPLCKNCDDNYFIKPYFEIRRV